MAGNMNIKTFTLILLLVCGVQGINAQNVEIGIRTYPSSWYNGWFEPAIDGGAIMAGYRLPLSAKYRIILNGEFAVLGSRNEILLGTGVRRTLWEKSRLRLSIEASLLNGLGLYRPAPLYTGGAEALFQLAWRTGKRFTLTLSAGGRYTLCPGYGEYGVWRYNSWPVGLGIGF
jgi:hypothetical protein